MAALIVTLPIAIAEELNLVYDANGNLISGDGFVREYNGFNQLVQVKNDSGAILEELVWHPTQEKILIKKVYNDSGDVAQRIVYVNENTIKITNSSGTFYEHYVYQDGILVAQTDADGNKEFLHSDHLGSTSLVTDENGNTIENSFYSPFGEEIEKGDSRFGYEGKEYDEKTKDTDFHFRKYRPEWGRFTQPDTLIQNVYNPQDLNRYSFENNNPYKYTDPDGHLYQSLALLGWFGAGLLILGVLAYTVLYVSQGVDKGSDTDTGLASSPLYNQEVENIQIEANEQKNVNYEPVNEGTIVPDYVKEQNREFCEITGTCEDDEGDNLDLRLDTAIENEIAGLVSTETDDEEPAGNGGGGGGGGGDGVNQGGWADCVEVSENHWVCTTS